MPCVKLARGAAPGALPPFSDAIDSNPCGKGIVTTINGVDVSAANLCLWHWALVNGLQKLQAPIVFGP